MIGAEALLHTLVDAGVDVCFMNPGTSEMHFVRALDAEPRMRGVLALFEGVATGAADGYARMAGRPAAVLLHLGPGLGNGLANLHNARRAHTPLLCVVGDHATDHARYDAPLQSDIPAVAGSVSGWVQRSGTTRELPGDAARAVAATRTNGGQIATLILPADVSWGEGAVAAAAPLPVARPLPVGPATIAAAAADLAFGPSSLLLLGGTALTAAGVRGAARIAAATGARLLVETFPARLEAGGGLPSIERLAYVGEAADRQLGGVEHLVLVGARPPVSFFGYPGRTGDRVPPGATVRELAGPGQDAEAVVVALAERLASGAATSAAPVPVAGDPDDDPRPLTAATLAAYVAASLPDQAIVVDEGNTSSFALAGHLGGAARHSLLTLTGGAIGQGLPTAVGAAVAAPDRPVLAIEADGSALYTIQALWTMAREQLDVTVVLINNAAYAILRMELARVGAGTAGTRAARMLDLSDPTPDFTALAAGLGVPARRASTGAELDEALRAAYAEPGPHLIEAIVTPLA